MPIQIIRQDITKMQVDAIVNTTNSSMIGYSGVDLAVHALAGPALDRECESLRPLALGQAKVSGGYGLPCKYVIHTSGPTWRGGKYGESDILRSCYLESLKRAVEKKCKTVAFPLISAGVYQFPSDRVLKFAVQTVTEFLLDHELMVYICVFDKESYSFSQKLFNDIKAFIDDEYVCNHGEDYYLSAASQTKKRVMRSNKPLLCDASISPNTSDLRKYLSNMEKSFKEKLFSMIDKKGISDVECYKRANVDKRTFSKIKSNSKYKPSKSTAIAFAIALELDIALTQELLATLGFTLSQSNVFDKIIMYFIHKKIYDVAEINQALFEFEQPLLGSV